MNQPLTALGVLAVAVCAYSSAFAEGPKPQPDPPPVAQSGTDGGSGDMMADVDPDDLARCQRDAVAKKIKGEARNQFVRSCVETED